ncbi:MAG: hypothetical protein NVSMB3_04180 [Acidobacteriaceae bacterium]
MNLSTACESSLQGSPRLLVFDLDGTLIDSSRDLCNSINATLSHFGKPELPDAIIATYIGDGASMLVRRAFGDPEGDLQDESYVHEALDYFLNFYRLHKLDFTTVYPGVVEALQTLRETYPSLHMACLTNKPIRPSEEICAELGLSPFFFRIYGGNSFHTKKPDPHGLLTLIQEASALREDGDAPAKIDCGETIMIGDSAVDVLTARNCGARSIGCTFGLAPHSLVTVPPDHLAARASDWPGIVATL